MTERSFHAMGCRIRVLITGPAQSADTALAEAQAWVEDFDRRLSRFRSDSELSALNADPRAEVPASTLLRAAIGAAVFAAEETEGLVDPTLVPQLERAGYHRSFGESTPDASLLREALAWQGARSAAAPNPNARWRDIGIDSSARTIRRPAGMRLDTGGTGKGLAADALATLLSGFDRVAIDCAGDVRIRGRQAMRDPFEIQIANPFSGAPVHSLDVGSGGVATSGIGSRIWRRPDGGFAHHLLDPSTGEPAWTGVVQATALAPSALQAETLSKAALLSGPDAGRRLLARHGGALVLDDGSLELLPPPNHNRLEVAA